MKHNIAHIAILLGVIGMIYSVIYYAVHAKEPTSPRATIIVVRKCEYILFNNTLTHCGDCTNHIDIVVR